MLKITNTEVFGWNAAIRGMRNAHESWEKSDSYYECREYEKLSEDNHKTYLVDNFAVGPNDLTLMKKLVAAGTDHSKFMRMIHVQCDMEDLIIDLNAWRDFYLYYKKKPYKDQKAHEENLKKIWWQIIEKLPTTYNQKATMDLNYATLRNMYHSCKNHKLDEWRIDFCNWVKALPYSELITMTKEELLESIKEG